MSFSRVFNAQKFVTLEKVVIRIPFHSLKAGELTFNKMDYSIPGNEIILTLNRCTPYKAPENTYTRYETPRNEISRAEYSDKSDPIWR